jgi:hypothetical protein
MLGARTGGIDSLWHRTYKRQFRVVTDNKWTGALAVRSAIPVALGNAYLLKDDTGTAIEHDDWAFCTKIEAAVESEDDLSWRVTVEYGYYDATIFGEQPLEHPIKISWGLTRFDTPLEQATDPNTGDIIAVVNSAGDYFDPPPTKDDSRWKLSIVRNEQTYDPSYADTYRDAVNNAVWFGGLFDVGTAKCCGILGTLQYNPTCGYYYEVTYEFEINYNTWKKKILDQGLYTLDSSNVYSPALDDKGAPVTQPVLLDGAGAKLAEGAAPVYLEFEVYSMVDFGPLGLDPSGAPGQEAYFRRRKPDGT